MAFYIFHERLKICIYALKVGKICPVQNVFFLIHLNIVWGFITQNGVYKPDDSKEKNPHIISSFTRLLQ